jgi:hypothetical protein
MITLLATSTTTRNCVATHNVCALLSCPRFPLRQRLSAAAPHSSFLSCSCLCSRSREGFLLSPPLFPSIPVSVVASRYGSYSAQYNISALLSIPMRKCEEVVDRPIRLQLTTGLVTIPNGKSLTFDCGYDAARAYTRTWPSLLRCPNSSFGAPSIRFSGESNSTRLVRSRPSAIQLQCACSSLCSFARWYAVALRYDACIPTTLNLLTGVSIDIPSFVRIGVDDAGGLAWKCSRNLQQHATLNVQSVHRYAVGLAYHGGCKLCGRIMLRRADECSKPKQRGYLLVVAANVLSAGELT